MSLIAQYLFKDNGNDEVGSYNGTISGSINFEDVPEGRNFGGKVAVFNRDGYLDLGNNFNFSVTNIYSFLFWIQPSSGFVFSKGGYNEAGYHYRYDGPFFATAASADNWQSDLKTPRDTAWYQMAIVKDASNLEIYYNGSLFSSLSTTKMGTVGRTFKLGRAPDVLGTFYSFVGKIANFRIYDSALTKATIAEIYRQETAPPSSQLLDWVSTN